MIGGKNNTMRQILLISPNFSRYKAGNSASTLRIAKGLQKVGIPTQIYDFQEGEPQDRLKQYDHEDYLWHCFNLVRCFPILAFQKRAMLIGSMTGTDFEKREKDERFSTMMQHCQLVLCQNQFQYDTLKLQYPEKQLDILYKGVLSPEFLSSTPYSLPPFLAAKKICLYPAGLRKVKGQHLYLEQMEQLAHQFTGIHWVFVGSIWDPHYAEEILPKINSSSVMTYLGEVEFTQMGHLYQHAFLLVNGSYTEGLPNTLLEAGQWNVPILCRRNSGNLSATDQGRFAWLFEDEHDFSQIFCQFYQNPLEKSVGYREWILQHFSVEAEIKKLQTIYTELSSSRFSFLGEKDAKHF